MEKPVKSTELTLKSGEKVNLHETQTLLLEKIFFNILSVLQSNIKVFWRPLIIAKKRERRYPYLFIKI